jgi:uncharacterized protein (TIGR02246 family)
MNRISAADRAALESIVGKMEDAWNAGDAVRFTAAFGADGDQINIAGTRMESREEIQAQHDRIFKTHYRGSRNRFDLRDARYVTADVILAHVHSVLDVPEGPRQGKIETLASFVFRKTGERLELVTLHNTRITPVPTAGASTGG